MENISHANHNTEEETYAHFYIGPSSGEPEFSA